ncbi:iron-containing alcohol dehydrogenase [candidate division WOR-3 bacterium]|nr:iron-containing alcohol dehydrogenase [candidate division WOR-3 bacterium]
MELKKFRYFNPVNIYFGDNIEKGIKEFIELYGKNIIIVTGKKSQFENGNYQIISNILKQYNVDFTLWNRISPNARYDEIDETISLKGNYNSIIALGGGSVLDSAKCIGAVIRNRKDIRSLLNDGDFDNLPILAIPTTAGTGSSVTQYSVLMDKNNNDKRGFAHKTFFPETAIISPGFTMSMPAKLTANTGLDALTHLIESYLSTRANPISDIMALKGIKLIKENLFAAYSESENGDARTNMAMASLLGGLAISQTGTILLHALGYPLTIYYDIPHGLANAIMLIPFIEFMEKIKVKRLHDILSILSLPELKDMFDKLNIKTGLKEYGIGEDIIDVFTNNVMDKKNLKSTPFEINEEVVIKLYRKSL